MVLMICTEYAAPASAHLESGHGGSANTPTLPRWKGNTDIWQKYRQSGGKYHFLLREIHLDSIRHHYRDGEEIQIFDRNTKGNIILRCASIASTYPGLVNRAQPFPTQSLRIFQALRVYIFNEIHKDSLGQHSRYGKETQDRLHWKL